MRFHRSIGHELRRRLRFGCLAVFLALVVGFSSSGCTENDSHAQAEITVSAATIEKTHVDAETTRRAVIRRACAYLWSMQDRDGGWHSTTYAYFRSGQALTPYILLGLLEVDEKTFAHPPAGVERALDSIRKSVGASGVVGLADPDVPEYPNYATGHALRCLLRAGDPADSKLISRMVKYLLAEQFRAENGHDESSPVHGAWGFGPPRAPGSPGHVDISYTRHVLEALRDAGVKDDAVVARAEHFLRFLQRHLADLRPQPPDGKQGVPYDGGFYLSPNMLPANKGGVGVSPDGTRYYRSYATATCDGVLALLAAGVHADDERIVAARRWLERHPRLDSPGGIPPDEPNGWAAAIHFYHLAVRAEALRALAWPGDWRETIVRLIAESQQDDGSFVNTRSHLMKEDDPLLCTALALVAVLNTLD